MTLPAEISVVDGHDYRERADRHTHAAKVPLAKQILTIRLGENLSAVMEEHTAMIVVWCDARHQMRTSRLS
jgi:hypothetical protein